MPVGICYAREVQGGDAVYILDDITYIKNPLVRENAFISAEPERGAPPEFGESRAKLPQPFWDKHEATIDCYWKAWELAFSNLRSPTAGNGFIRGYIDTAFNNHLFMWDSAFALQFGKYGMRAFDFLGTLDNLYARQHPDGFICREIDEKTGQDCFQRHDPASTGPNVMAWTEWDYYRTFGDVERLRNVYPALLTYYQWCRMYRSWPDGSYWYTGWGGGVDNQPRQDTAGIDTVDRKAYDELLAMSHGHMTWIDACLHQVLSAGILLEIAKVIGRGDGAEELRRERDYLARYVNEKMWDEETSFYYDRYRDGRLSGVKSIVAYWALLAGVVPDERLERFIARLREPAEFARPSPGAFAFGRPSRVQR